MLMYKGFHKDLTCTLGRGRYQYRENEWIEEPAAGAAQKGFHGAENPLDCLTYYGNWNDSAYYLVEADGDIDEDGSDSKIACTRIRLIHRLSMYEFVTAAVEYICQHPTRGIRERTGMVMVAKDKGAARENGAVIVFGETPQAAGPVGSILALVRMGPDGTVEGVCIRKVDGEKCKGNTWYRI